MSPTWKILHLQQKKPALSIRTWSRMLCLGAVALLLAGCGGNDAAVAQEPPDPVQIRAPHPTFTPTPQLGGNAPALAVVSDVPSANSAEEPTPSPTSVPLAPPTSTAASIGGVKHKLVVNTQQHNLRAGPGTEFPIVTLVERGQEFDIVGKNTTGDWWNICCHEGKAVWVTNQFADTDGPVDQVPILTVTDVAVATNNTAASEPPTAPAATPTTPQVTTAAVAPGLPFDLIVQEQFPESKVVRIFLYVYDAKNALEGYTLRVAKDGAEQPVTLTSFGPNPGFTWPIADPRQRFQNMKVEFPGVSPAGLWEVQLIDNGAPAGPPATFTLGANEPKQELYVRYQKR
jgi:SH3-like domain-containing protein